jgi:hypothetical protein
LLHSLSRMFHNFIRLPENQFSGILVSSIK